MIHLLNNNYHLGKVLAEDGMEVLKKIESISSQAGIINVKSIVISKSGLVNSTWVNEKVISITKMWPNFPEL